MRVKTQKATKVTGDKKIPCRKCGKVIETGDTYKKAKGRYGPRLFWCGTCVPRQSELTTSDKKSRLYGAAETIEDVFITDNWTVEDVESAVSDAADAANEVSSEYRDVADEHFGGGGPNAELADVCEEWAQECEAFQVPDQEEDESGVDWHERIKEEALELAGQLGV